MWGWRRSMLLMMLVQVLLTATAVPNDLNPPSYTHRWQRMHVHCMYPVGIKHALSLPIQTHAQA